MIMFLRRYAISTSPSTLQKKRGFTTTSGSNPTVLSKYLKTMIKLNGPISCYEFMKLANINPVVGYYNKPSHVFNRQGDFITSPEISQTFGELVGLWYYLQWEKVGKPKKVKIVELGPGLGTLLEDVLRTFENFPNLFQSLQEVEVVEGSEGLARKQLQRWVPTNQLNLPQLSTQLPNQPKLELGLLDGPSCTNSYGVKFSWRSSWDTLQDTDPDTFLIVLAHEFFDALPIYRLTKVEPNWREILVDFDPNLGKFQFVVSNQETKGSTLANATPDLYQTQTQIELAPDATKVMEKLNTLFQTCEEGVGLIIDYGQDYIQADTLRGIKDHRFCDPLENPGSVDLSANVNFHQLKTCISNPTLHCLGPVTQRQFLLEMGLQTRLQQLLHYQLKHSQKTNQQLLQFKTQLELDYQRLTHADEMGTTYKFLALTKTNRRLIGF